jgi:homoserine dehydrogenase
MSSSEVQLGIAVLGAGNVGAAFVSRCLTKHDQIVQKTGVDLGVRGVGVRDTSVTRDGVPASLIANDLTGLVKRDDVDVVVELMGGIEPARSLIIDALNAGKSVVTANKALIAQHGTELLAIARQSGVDLLFEAAVGGGVPLVRTLRESFAGEQLREVLGIVNGTTNFILTRMSQDGLQFADALKQAQDLGYAEADPTADVEGFDAAAKACILAMIGFGATVTVDQVDRHGITTITADDVVFAQQSGHDIKLIASVRRDAQGRVSAAVSPTLVASAHPLASVRDSFNAIFIDGEAVGNVMLYGRGAGGDPTASAVLGDVLDAAHNRLTRSIRRTPTVSDQIQVTNDTQPRDWYVHLLVTDQPGVLSRVAAVLAEHDVSIASMRQTPASEPGHARIVFELHPTDAPTLRASLQQLSQLDDVAQVVNALPMIGV